MQAILARSWGDLSPASICDFLNFWRLQELAFAKSRQPGEKFKFGARRRHALRTALDILPVILFA